MARATGHGRQARLDLEILEGRALLSARLGFGMTLGHLGTRQLFASVWRPSQMSSLQETARHLGPPPIRALMMVPRPGIPAITAAVTAGPDSNRAFTISGRTYPWARVGLDLQADGTIEQTTKASSRGLYSFKDSFDFGMTAVRVSETAPGHWANSTILMVNGAQSPVTVPTGTSQPPVTVPTGTSGNVNDPGIFQLFSSASSGWANDQLAVDNSLS
jgi:hypothetical protein